MSDQELVDYLSTKSIDELQTDKYKPFINKVKNACDENTFKKFYAKERVTLCIAKPFLEH